MSMTPGAVGSKSLFPDGMQVDHVSENTGGHGVSLAGRTSGVSLDDGYVGQLITVAVNTSMATLTDTNLASYAVPAGVWMIWFGGRVTGSGKTLTALAVNTATSSGSIVYMLRDW
jgi:hypothetical protein